MRGYPFVGHMTFPIENPDASMGDIKQEALANWKEALIDHGLQPAGRVSYRVEHGTPSQITITTGCAPLGSWVKGVAA